MIRILVFFIFLISFEFLFSQRVTTNTDKKFDGELSFNEDYIKQNRLKALTASIANKPDNKIIEDKGLIKGYEFNEAGKQVRYYYTVISSMQQKEIEVPAVYRRGKKISGGYSRSVFTYTYDTISTRYIYNEKNYLIIKRTRYGDSYSSWYYNYNEDGMVVKQINARETNLNRWESDFKLGVQSIISKEEFQYEKLSDRQLKIKCLNDEGRLFKTIIINKDEKGRVLNESHEFFIGGILQEYKYEYDVNGRVTKTSYSSNENGSKQVEHQYIYDDKNNLVTEIYLKGGEKTDELSYLYDEKNNSLKSLLDRDFINKSIGIIKYSWSFY